MQQEITSSLIGEETLRSVRFAKAESTIDAKRGLPHWTKAQDVGSRHELVDFNLILGCGKVGESRQVINQRHTFRLNQRLVTLIGKQR